MQEIKFDVENHIYSVDGVNIPSVTQVMQAVGMIDIRWFKPEHAQRGTDIHKLTEDYDNRVLDFNTINPEYMGYFEAWLKALSEITIFYVEKMFYHHGFGYCGTVDRIAGYRDKIGTLDIKTGSPMEWHEVQLGGYSQGIEDTTDLSIETGICVYLKKTGSYKIVEKQIGKGRRAFNAALSVYKFNKANKGLLHE